MTELDLTAFNSAPVATRSDGVTFLQYINISATKPKQKPKTGRATRRYYQDGTPVPVSRLPKSELGKLIYGTRG